MGRFERDLPVSAVYCVLQNDPALRGVHRFQGWLLDVSQHDVRDGYWRSFMWRELVLVIVLMEFS